MRLEFHPTNYHITQSLWKKPISTDNLLVASIQKVCYVAAAVFTAIYETLRNLVFVIPNLCIAANLCKQALKQGRTIVCLAEKLGDDAPESLRMLAARISGKQKVGSDIKISTEDGETIRRGLKKKNLTMADIEQMSAAHLY